MLEFSHAKQSCKANQKGTDMTTLWKYNKVTGYWDYCRDCEKSTAQEWLKVWQEDEPEVIFKIAKNRPKDRPKSK